MDLISARLTDEYPDTNEGDGILLVPLQESVTESIRPTLQVLLGAVGVLLLIACGNVANLLLARASGREQEMALRQALGASRRRITSQLLTESTLLAGAGGILGALLAVWLTSGLLSLAPEGIPRVSEVGVNLRFAAFAVLLSLTAGLVTGILPSLRAAGRDRTEGALFSGARLAGSRGRIRSAFSLWSSAVTRSPSSPELRARAMCAVRLPGRIRNALRLCSRALAKSPCSFNKAAKFACAVPVFGARLMTAVHNDCEFSQTLV